jgi:hypothetical protein
MLTFKNLPRSLFLLSLAVIVVGLPASKFLMSLGQFGIVAAWLLNGNYYNSLKKFIANKTLVVLSSLFILHLLGLLYTQNFTYALRDIRIKLPIFILPFFSAAFLPLKKKEWLLVLHLFVASVFMVSVFGYYRLTFYPELPFSAFVSHIRFGLMLVLSVFICLYFIKIKLIYKGIYWLMIVNFFVALYLLGSLTAIIALFMVLAALILILPSKNISFRQKLLGSFSLIIIVVSVFYFKYYKAYQQANAKKELPVQSVSPNGEKYYNDLNFTEGFTRENGYYIWQNIAWNELRKSWQKVSNKPFDDSTVNALKYTLVRYMTSKGFNKDATDFKKLSPQDIKAIEKGIANYRLTQMNKLERKIYQTIWELEVWKSNGNPSGHSLVMRFIYWQSAIQVWLKHSIIGVGTGDVYDEVMKWQKENSKLEDGFFKHPHNQYLTMLVTFGIIGFVWFLIWIFYPVFSLTNHHFLTLSFLVIVLISYFNEDTLETQAGVTFVMVFSTIFYSSKKVY